MGIRKDITKEEFQSIVDKAALSRKGRFVDLVWDALQEKTPKDDPLGTIRYDAQNNRIIRVCSLFGEPLWRRIERATKSDRITFEDDNLDPSVWKLR